MVQRQLVIVKEADGFRHVFFTGFPRLWKAVYKRGVWYKHLLFSDSLAFLSYVQLGFAYRYGNGYSMLGMLYNMGGGPGFGHVLMVWDFEEYDTDAGVRFMSKLNGMLLEADELAIGYNYRGMKHDVMSKGKVYSPEFRNTAAYRDIVLRGEGITFRGIFRGGVEEMLSFFDGMVSWEQVYTAMDYVCPEVQDYEEGRYGI